MRPIFQTKFGCPDGNCHAAAVASILEIDLDSIPDFGIDDEWFIRFSRWARSTHAIEPLKIFAEDDKFPSGFHLMSGQSPRGDFKHCVVAFAGKMIHDPHPSGDDLLEVKTFTVFTLLDPKIVPEKKPQSNGRKCDAPNCDCPTRMLALAGMTVELHDLTFCSDGCVEEWWDLHGEPIEV